MGCKTWNLNSVTLHCLLDELSSMKCTKCKQQHFQFLSHLTQHRCLVSPSVIDVLSPLPRDDGSLREWWSGLHDHFLILGASELIVTTGDKLPQRHAESRGFLTWAEIVDVIHTCVCVCVYSWMALTIRQNCCRTLVLLRTRPAPALVAAVTQMISCRCLRRILLRSVARCSWSLHLVETV